MMLRKAILPLLLGLMISFAAGSTAPAGMLIDQIVAAELAVKQMPLECRPNRLGHIYGNNVRRIQQGKLCVNCGQYPNPVLRFFYIP